MNVNVRYGGVDFIKKTIVTKTYSISELAQEFDVTTRSLRFYEEKGLLSPSRHKQTRSYDHADRTRLKLILRGKRLGFSLDESAEIINMYDPKAGNKNQMQVLLNKVKEKCEQLLEQQQDLEMMLLDLRKVEDRCLTSLNQKK